MAHLIDQFDALKGTTLGEGYTVASADEFTYVDHVDGSISRNQGVRLLFVDGSRIIFRLSGTAGSGATIRMYLEKYVPSEAGAAQFARNTAEVMSELVAIALKVSNLKEITGFESPSFIT